MVADEATVKKLNSQVTLIRTSLNVLCRKFSNEDASEISQEVSVAINQFLSIKAKLQNVRNALESKLRAQFKKKAAQFESYVRKHTAQLQLGCLKWFLEFNFQAVGVRYSLGCRKGLLAKKKQV